MNPGFTPLVACIGVALLMSATPAHAQAPPQAGAGPRNVPIATRLVLRFSDLENEIAAAQHAADTATLDRLLDADFEERSAAAPEVPLPRAQWIERKPVSAPGEILHMAVHDHATVAVASFEMRSTPRGAAIFVVDVWKKQGEAWQLATRYRSVSPPASSSASPARRPTGRD